jgi:CRISPR-associated protein Cas2
MSMTVFVTRNVAGRFRGFLASVACEIAPGVYTAPRMTAGVRARVWAVLEGWWQLGDDALIVMTWSDPSRPGGQDVAILGGAPEYETAAPAAPPRRELVEHDGVFLVRTPLGKNDYARLGLADPEVPF